ncbi:MAG: flagellar hook-length control protein FliK [Rhodobacteraceae bacterium]|nr:flagellar hook-length control protein FliK [Paracoccaceae bacterium]
MSGEAAPNGMMFGSGGGLMSQGAASGAFAALLQGQGDGQGQAFEQSGALLGEGTETSLAALFGAGLSNAATLGEFGTDPEGALDEVTEELAGNPSMLMAAGQQALMPGLDPALNAGTGGAVADGAASDGQVIGDIGEGLGSVAGKSQAVPSFAAAAQSAGALRQSAENADLTAAAQAGGNLTSLAQTPNDGDVPLPGAAEVADLALDPDGQPLAKVGGGEAGADVDQVVSTAKSQGDVGVAQKAAEKQGFMQRWKEDLAALGAANAGAPSSVAASAGALASDAVSDDQLIVLGAGAGLKTTEQTSQAANGAGIKLASDRALSDLQSSQQPAAGMKGAAAPTVRQEAATTTVDAGSEEQMADPGQQPVKKTVAAGTGPDGPVAANTAKVGAPAGAAGQVETVDVAIAPVDGGLSDGEGEGLDTELISLRDLGSNSKLQAAGTLKTDSMHADVRNHSGQISMQVAGAMARNLQNGNTRFQMRFDPPELGRVDVSMKVASDGSVQAHMIVERPETLDMFLRDQRALERALESAGLSTNSENLQFSLKDQSGQGQQFAEGEGDGRSGFGYGSPEGNETNDTIEQVAQIQLTNGQRGLDIRI